MTTHYLEEADSLTDRIAIMNEGKIIESGTSFELKQRYSGGQILRITGENISGEIPEILNKRGLETEVVPNGIEIKSQELDFYSVMDILHQKKVVIKGIQMKEPTLDEVFLKLTEKEAPK